MTFDYHFFVFFECMQVWWTFGIKMLIFLSLCTVGSQNHTFLASHAGFGEVQVTKPAEGMQF